MSEKSPNRIEAMIGTAKMVRNQTIAEVEKIIDKFNEGEFYFNLHTRGCDITNAKTQSYCSRYKHNIIQELKEEIKNLKDKSPESTASNQAFKQSVSQDTRKGCGKSILCHLSAIEVKCGTRCTKEAERHYCSSCKSQKVKK